MRTPPQDWLSEAEHKSEVVESATVRLAHLRSIREEIAPFEAFRQRHRALLRLGMALIIAGVVGIGLRWIGNRADPPVEAVLPRVTTTSNTAPGAGESGELAKPAEVVVAVVGAVNTPGVYSLANGGRVTDAIAAAGGVAAGADVSRINLAQKLADEARIYVPRQGETEPPLVDVGGAGQSSVGSSGDHGVKVVNINTADEAALDALPGVGPTTAAAIVEYRKSHGAYRSVEDLGKVKGIGDAKLSQIRPLVRVS